jgi:hypothetical protein
MADENTLTDGDVPESFWSVSDKFISDDTLRLLHSEMCSKLRQENPHADSLELMAIERICSLYFYLRFMESSGRSRGDAAYKNLMQVWMNMAADLRKSRIGSQDEDQIRGEILTGVSRAVTAALQGIDPDTASTVKRRIVERLERV